MLRFLPLIILNLLLVNAYSQTASVAGRIIDNSTREALPFVNIVVEGTNFGTTSDDKGNFKLAQLEEGQVKLTASFIGYEVFTSDYINIKNGETTDFNVQLSFSETTLEEVVISVSPYERPEIAVVSMQSIRVDDISTNPGANGDISKVIQSFPGVSSGASFRNDIMVRGGGPAENTFYIDEIEVPTINHFQTQGSSGGTNSMINSDQLNSVDFYSGAFPVNKPNALSSVFNFNLMDGHAEKPKFRFAIGASEAALSGNGSAGNKSDYVFSIRRSYLEFLFSALELPFLPTFNDYQVKWKTRINEKNEIKIISIGAYDQFKLNTGIKSPDAEQEYILNNIPESKQWNYAIGGVYKHFNESNFQTLVVSRNMLSYTSQKFTGNDPDNPVIFDYESQEIENKVRFEHTEIFKSVQFTASVNAEYIQYNSNSYNPVYINGNVIDFRSNTNIDFFKWGGSFSFIQKLMNDRMKLVFGIRTDANNFTKPMSNAINQLSPRISASYQIQPTFKLTASIGRYYRLPAYTTLGHRDTESLLVNQNEDMKYIRSDQVILGFEYLPTENILFTVEGFYKDYDNYPVSMIDTVSLATTGGGFGVYGIGPVKSIGTGRAYGIELMNRSKIGKKLNITASYTFYRSEMKDKEGNYVSTSWDNKHLFVLTSTYRFLKDWSAGLKWRYAGGAPYTPYDLETSSVKQAWDTQNEPFKNWNEVNSERFPAFHQLDIRIDKRFHFKKLSVNLYIDIQNAYNFKAKEQDLIMPEKDDNGNNILTADGKNYALNRIPSATGTVIPTIGIIVDF